MHTVLFENDIAIITREPGFIRVRRTGKPIVDTGAAYGAVDDLKDRFRILLPLRERRGWGLLIDSRDAPMGGSSDAPDPLRAVVAEMMLEFARVAILVKTALGVLQATRRAREDAGPGRPVIPVFSDEAGAISYLRTEDPAVPPPRSSRHGY